MFYILVVSIGYNPYVVVTQFELEDMLEKSKGRPKFFTLRLAEKLFGIDVLVKSTPYGIGGKAALHPAILDAIKGISKYIMSNLFKNTMFKEQLL